MWSPPVLTAVSLMPMSNNTCDGGSGTNNTCKGGSNTDNGCECGSGDNNNCGEGSSTSELQPVQP